MSFNIYSNPKREGLYFFLFKWSHWSLLSQGHLVRKESTNLIRSLPAVPYVHQMNQLIFLYWVSVHAVPSAWNMFYGIVLYCVFFLLSASHTSFPWHLIFQASALLRSLEWVKVSAIIPPSQLWSHCLLILVVFSTRCKLCEGRGDLSRLLLFLWHPQNAWLLVGTQPNISLKKKQWQNIPWLVNYSVRNTMDHCLPLCCPVQYRPTELVAMMEMLHSLHRSVQ